MAALIRSMFCYRIVRFYKRSGRREIISTRLALSMAQYHCSLDSSSRPGVWFDGWELMPGYSEPFVLLNECEAAQEDLDCVRPQPGFVQVEIEEDGEIFTIEIAVGN